MDRGVDSLVDEIDTRILAAIGAGAEAEAGTGAKSADSAEEAGYRVSSATQLLHYNASVGAYGAHTDCHDFRGK
jgi:hypothetical protein